MNILIDKKRINNLDTAPYKAMVNSALDYIWTMPWVKESISNSDLEKVEPLEEVAEKIAKQSKILVIVATGIMGKLIKAAVLAFPKNEDRPEIIVFGDSLSPRDYASLIKRVEDERFSLLAISDDEEEVSFRGAYSTLKQILIGKRGPQDAAERIYVITSKKSEFLSKDVVEDDLKMMSFREGFDPCCGANSEAVLLPLLVMGLDGREFLSGFRTTLASPKWDLDGADYSISKAAFLKKEGGASSVLVWQRQLQAFGEWIEAANAAAGFSERLFFMDDDGAKNHGKVYETILQIEKDEADIMMPSFEGCNEDGSLNLLLNEEINKYFFSNNSEKSGVMIELERLDSNSLGQLFGFVEISNEIVKYLCKN